MISRFFFAFFGRSRFQLQVSSLSKLRGLLLSHEENCFPADFGLSGFGQT